LFFINRNDANALEHTDFESAQVEGRIKGLKTEGLGGP
jgi:hypothetical protein